MLLAEYLPKTATTPLVDSAHHGMWRYHALLPIEHVNYAVTLGEGGTPLVRSERIATQLGLKSLYFKLEGSNPTGSYKDRIAAVGMTRMKELGVTGWAATSSGNAGAALAAYGARAGTAGKIFTLETAPRAKLTQILAHAPQVVAVQGLGRNPAIERDTFAAVRQLCEQRGWLMQITAHRFSPVGMEGAKTIAYEIAEELGNAPNAVYVPTGGGGLLSAIARGFGEWAQHGCISHTPHMICVQSLGCDPIAQAWRGEHEVRPIPTCNARISGIQLTAPPDGDLALELVHRSHGWATSVPDSETYAAQKMLAQFEGVFVEPAAAIGLAAVMRDLRDGKLQTNDSIVCICTGTGFKDTTAAQALSEGVEIPLITVEDILDS
jgi:threonine synthase